MPPITRRHFFMGSMALPAAAQRKATPQRPNIVLILADDLAAWMLGCYGNKEIRTPNIDRLARMGTRFINSFVVTPICSASRATLFTGRTPMQHGIHDFLTPEPIANPAQGQAAPPPSFRNEVMISDVLADAGYECGYTGKWHMGSAEEPQHGYKFWYTMPGDSGPYQDPAMNLNGKSVQEKGYLGDLITARASEFLDRQNASRPFFLTVSYLNPHTPYDGHPQQYYDMYANTAFDTVGWQPMAANALREKEMMKDPVANIRRAAAATTALDDQVAALFKKLQARTGGLDNTLVIFTSDNGYLLGRHGLWSKGLASDPPNMYEEVMQVPMMWSWMGRLPADNTRPELIDFCDFLPSVCEAAGVSAPANRNLAGRSYLAVAANKPLPKKEPWRNLVFGQFRNTWMVRDFRYKVVVRNDGKGPNELYDLRTDPNERTNQYDNQQFVSTRDRLNAELAAWRKKYSS
ncbi:MAG TPA: sulfatase-like hydrolase/transferase [Bryobacteraceae bacterium]|nr:sulfatase-like hydrolase/transferase [Bryobacteraceae bacterium]